MPAADSHLLCQHHYDPVRDNAQLYDAGRLRRMRLGRLGCAPRRDNRRYWSMTALGREPPSIAEASLPSSTIGRDRPSAVV